MNPQHQQALSAELTRARHALAAADLDGAMLHLERAHVLGQRHVVAHVVVHLLMLRVALHRGDAGAALGQAVRVILGAVGSALGRVPVGNPGGSDVNMFEERPIDPALLAIMEGRAAASTLAGPRPATTDAATERGGDHGPA